MIAIDRNCAQRLMACIRHFTPCFPQELLLQVDMLEAKMMSGYCDEALLLQIYCFIKGYVQKKNDTFKREAFFEQLENLKYDEDENVEVEMLSIIHLILPNHLEYQSKIMRGIKK